MLTTLPFHVYYKNMTVAQNIIFCQSFDTVCKINLVMIIFITAYLNVYCMSNILLPYHTMIKPTTQIIFYQVNTHLMKGNRVFK